MSLFEKFTLGTCYYPEHWGEENWSGDLERMLENGITVVRVGEFSWSLVERTEGVFDFSFWDRFLDLCARRGMQVIFGTPTATPPAWLTEKWPEVLNAREDGVLYRHGGRRHASYTSPVWRELCARVVGELARHLGRHPAIIGWQIDNELNCEQDTFHAESDTLAFRAFLQEKYGSLENLNEAWGTVFWSQTYTDWSQIFVPRVNAVGARNPSMELDYIRFVSRACMDFCQMQSRILRMYVPENVFITTNGMYGHVDNHEMTRTSLDVYMYDSYPNFAYGLDRVWDPEAMNDRAHSMNLTEVRSVCPRFGIMEQQSGANGWYNRMEAPMPRPGQIRLWTLQSLAHGAEFISYFRWRTATMGTEIYWHGILDWDGRDNRRLREVREISRLLPALSPLFGAPVHRTAALLRDYDNVWDAEVDHWHGRVSRVSEQGVFEACQKTHTPMDLFWLDHPGNLPDYEVAFLPHSVIMSPERLRLLRAYVEQGGILVIGCRSGYKDETGRCVTMPMPGLFSELTGSRVEEYSFASPAEEDPFITLFGTSLKAEVFVESLEPLQGTETVSVYESGWLRGKPAVTRRSVGRGQVWHVGSVLSEAVVSALLKGLEIQGAPAFLHLPRETELVIRDGKDRKYYIALNYRNSPLQGRTDRPLRSLIRGERVERIELEPYGVDVWEEME